MTYGDLVTTVPFENSVDTLELRGDHLFEMLEYSVTKSWDDDRFNGANMVQFSGMNFFLIEISLIYLLLMNHNGNRLKSCL